MATDDLVFGIARVKDEADIIGSTLDHMLTQVDHVIIADNDSTDGTWGLIAERQSDRCHIRTDPEVGYFQSRQMSALAREAAEMGAAWVVPWDADEVWVSAFGGTVGDALRAVPADYLAASAALFDHVPTGVDPTDPDPVRSIQYRRPKPAPLPKVAARTSPRLVIEQGNHSVTYGIRPASLPGQLVIHHYPYRSPEQFIRKAKNGAAAYAATDLPETAGSHWRSFGRLISEGGDQVGEEIFRKWYWRSTPAAIRIDDEDQPALVHDPVSVGGSQ